MEDFDYGEAAELFPVKNGHHSRAIGYMRFARAADAIRYAIENLSARQLPGTTLLVDDVRFNGEAIRRLYADEKYPLGRRKIRPAQPVPPLNGVATPAV